MPSSGEYDSTHDDDEEDPDHVEVEHPTESSHQNNSKPSKQQWEDARGAIIAELKNPTSEIHLTILTLRATKKEKCKIIWQRYAPAFDEKKVVDSLAHR